MVPFKETINTKQELIEACKKGFEYYSDRIISKNDFCMYFGFTHGKAITTFYKGDYEQLLLDGGFNSGSSAYFSAGINAWKNLNEGIYTFPPFDTNDVPLLLKDAPLQQIFYGAPGTGKSHKVKELTEKESVVRTTFHPDSDYSTFVGAYKPTSIEVPMRDVTGKVIVENGQKVTENRIVYEFVEQAFLKAYIKAWKMYAEDENNPKKQYLVIEEINRGNCAQIFGDLFQLLDRGDNGFSEYPIDADKDMQKHLAKAFKDMAYLEAPAIGEMSAEETARAIRNGEKLILPSNLYILATMNTSDQSLFPIDSAFKRRWDWKYEPIKYENTNWKIEIGGTKYLWTDFQKTVNNKIFDDTSSEDKMLGDYFVNPPTGIISEDLFLNKILFYLWNDVCKDGDGDIFKTEDNKDVKFSDLYGDNGITILLSMMRHLEVFPIDGTSDDNDEDEEDEAAEGKDYTRYTINGEGNIPKRQLSTQAVRKYIELNPELTPEQVVANWMSLGNIVSHFVETKEQFDARTDNSKRSIEVPCGDTKIYVAWNGWGIGNKMQTLIDSVNNKDWGIRLAIKE